MKQDRSGNPARAIGLLLVAGAASLFSLFSDSPKQPQVSDRPNSSAIRPPTCSPLPCWAWSALGERA
ncbi:MAG: hypothetical protein HC895_25535 [Leptolyngbyaceae cyanobacterium SM1_3_5]|nr:hypothetical protein [Leptolyngbyaceae cyanobacterium SM1_3_5]